MFDLEKKPQTLKEILAIYAKIDARANCTTCYMLDFGVVQGVKETIRKTRNPAFRASIY